LSRAALRMVRLRTAIVHSVGLRIQTFSGTWCARTDVRTHHLSIVFSCTNYIARTLITYVLGAQIHLHSLRGACNICTNHWRITTVTVRQRSVSSGCGTCVVLYTTSREYGRKRFIENIDTRSRYIVVLILGMQCIEITIYRWLTIFCLLHLRMRYITAEVIRDWNATKGDRAERCDPRT
jgi:hypothetical protein